MNERSKLTGGWILLISLSFSCGTPGPAEEIGPEIRVSEGRVLEVSKGQPFEAGPLIALGGGELVLGMSGSSLVSLDRGETWSIRPPFPKSHVLVRRDGPAYVLKGRTEPASDTPGLFAADYLEADDAGAIPTNPTTWKQATVTLPQWTSLTGDDGTHVTTLHITGPLLELRDGTLLAGSYGNFQGDTASIEGFVPTEGEKWFKYRTYLLRSADSGRNWNYYSTVAYDGVTGQESFCEPAVVDFGDGKMLAVMRTGRFAPMYQARSLDGGLSWGKPESTKILGLAPQMVILENGILVCTFGWRPLKKLPSQVDGGGYIAALQDYRRRYQEDVGIEDPSQEAGDYVMMSVDRGRSWSTPQRIAEPLTAGYTLLAPSGKDRGLVLTRRMLLPGLSRQEILQKWRDEWDPKPEGIETVIEARTVEVVG